MTNVKIKREYEAFLDGYKSTVFKMRRLFFRAMRTLFSTHNEFVLPKRKAAKLFHFSF